MKSFFTTLAILTSAVAEARALACPVWAGQICGYNKRSGFDTLRRSPNYSILNGQLVKRDGPVAGSDPTATTYLYVSLPQWAALPGSSCGYAYQSNGGTTTAICPVGFKCQCQPSGNICITTAAPNGCAQFDPGTVYDTCTVRWTTTITDVASAFGQCGGFTESSVIAGSAWTTATMCPQGYGCACRNFWYSQCLPTASYALNCPPATRYWACASTLTPGATGRYRQCGGICWDLLGSAKGCDAGDFCWTKTSDGYEAPGQYAMCGPTRPNNEPYWQATPQSLCYPAPYTYTPGDAPLCEGGNGNDEQGGEGGGSQTLWGQCGGSNYEGPSDCPAGSVCEYQNQWFSQCVTGSKRIKKSATPVRNVRAVVTPVRELTQRDLLGPPRPGMRPRMYR
ncbi:hypothetical protein TWF730_002616 [Orbilia blumenaviensis]|uniref:CBM1 domain-containing protein n=1 Tax=Orbilia blumenaviensis TaxID=1796055 RepID=A0AAV9UEK6_9PEZI